MRGGSAFFSILVILLFQACATTTFVTPIGNLTYEPSLSPVVGVDTAGEGVALGVGKSLIMTGDSMYLNTDKNLKNLDSIAENFMPEPPTADEEIEENDIEYSYHSKRRLRSTFLIQNNEEEIDPEELLPEKNGSLKKQKELTLLAMCVYGESRSESYEGKLSIAHVVMNRVKEKSWYGKTVKEVLLKPYQFSCFSRRDPNYKKLFRPNKNLWKQCFKAAWNAYSQLSNDPTLGSNHYCRHDISPPWKKAMELKKRIGNHDFFKVSTNDMRDWWYANVPSKTTFTAVSENDALKDEFYKFNYLMVESEAERSNRETIIHVDYGL